jgi:valyl-tRNA synthetase
VIKEDGTATVQALTPSTFVTATAETQAIKALAGKGVTAVSILGPDSPAPTGCAVYSVGSNATVFLEVKGRVDLDAEIKKGKEKMKKAAEGVEKQRKLLGAPDFEQKVSGAVQQVEKAKLEDFLAEQRNRELSIQQFEQLKLE